MAVSAITSAHVHNGDPMDARVRVASRATSAREPYAELSFGDGGAAEIVLYLTSAGLAALDRLIGDARVALQNGEDTRIEATWPE